MPTTGQIIKERRELLGISQVQVAKHMGVSDRTVARWEENQAQLSYPGSAAKLAALLGLGLDEMAGVVPIGLDLGGEWHARWHTSRNGKPIIDKHGLIAVYAYDRMAMNATGDYRWRGDCQVIGYDLTGTYRSIEADVEHRGALYFWLHPNMQAAVGHWVGRSSDCVIGTGWGVLARASKQADQLIETLVEHGYKNLTEWPQTGANHVDQ